jgi:hypothetical protein
LLSQQTSEGSNQQDGGNIPRCPSKNSEGRITVLQHYLVTRDLLPYESLESTPYKSMADVQPKPSTSVKLVLLEEAAVGKFSLVMRFVNNDFQKGEEPTIVQQLERQSLEKVREDLVSRHKIRSSTKLSINMGCPSRYSIN